MRYISLFLCLIFVVGCATTDKPPAVGSNNWHTQRVAEIQHAYDLGEINFETYVQLKNEADKINVDYRSARGVQTRPSIGLGIGVGHYHHRHRHRRH
jgi:hypothetical protein